MPHLPPPTVIGGSVKIRIPLYEVHFKSKRKCGEDLFKRELVIDRYPPRGKKQYKFAQYSASDAKAKIYKIEIHGVDKDEVFEFRPKDGRCRIEIYYAVSKELPLRYESRWLEPGEELCANGPSEHEHA